MERLRTDRGLSFTSDVRGLFLSLVTQKYLNHRHPTFHPTIIPTLCSLADPTFPPQPMAASGISAWDFHTHLRCYSVGRDRGSRSLAVDASGAVWRAGEYSDPANDSSWIGDDGLGNSWLMAVVGVSPQRNMVSGLSSIVSVAAGNMQNLALDTNGEVWAWGGNGSGELGLGDTLSRTTPTKIPGLVNVISISAGKGLSPLPGGSQSLALDKAGHVWAWGENEFGELGLSDSLDRNSPQLVPGLSKIKAISAGGAGCSAVDSSGRLWVWGLNDQGQLGLGDTNIRRSPTPVPSMGNVSSVSHGLFPVVVDKNGMTFWSCGTACGNGFVQKKSNSFTPGSGVDQFGLTVAP